MMITLRNVHDLWRLTETFEGLMTHFLKAPRKQENETC